MESETGVVYVCPDAPGEVVDELRDRVGRVATVIDAADCLAELSSADCVVLTDDLPHVDPAECCRRIRDRRSDLPVIAFPADGSESLAGEVIAAGADGYVPRADGVDTLAARIDVLLEDGDDSDGAPAHGSTTASADRIESLIEQSPLAIIEWSLDFEVESWNPAATNLFGYTESEARGESGPELIVPDDVRGEVLEHWKRLIDADFDGQTAWRTNENVRKDGTAITCEWVNTPLTDDGEIVGVLSFVQDVTTEHKRAEALEALQKTTRELMRAESTEEIASIVVDATDHVIDHPLATLRFYDEDRGALELAAASETLDEVTDEIPPIGRGEGMLWEAYEDGEPFVAEESWTDRIPYDLETDIGMTVFQPLNDHGMLTVAAVGDDDLDRSEIHLVHVLAAAAEAALDRAARERELERTQAIVETVGDCVYRLDAEGRFVTVNDTMAKMCNYDRDELVGEHVSKLLTDESVERGRRHIRELAADDDRHMVTYEVTLVGRDGERTPAEINMGLLCSDGECEGSVGIARDISDRKRMERELVERKAKIERLHEVASRLEECESRREIYEHAVEAAEDVLNFDVCVIDRVEDDHLVKAALSSTLEGDFVRRMGIDEGIAGRTYRTRQTYRIDDIRTDTDAEPRDDALRSVLSVPIGEWGVFQTVSTETGAFSREDEELAELLLSHVTDALDRIAFEEQLRAERDRFAALFENVPDAVVSTRQTDGDAIVESVNPAFERIFGYDESTIVGESLDRFIVPADRSSEAEAFTRLGANGETVETEVKRRTVDGLRDFMMRVVPVDPGESTDHAFGLYTDISDQKQRQKRVEILNRVLRHDMRNGMNIIDGCAEMLAEAVEDDDVEYATTIQERAGELVALAEKTRAVERVLERESATTGPIDVTEAIAEAVDRLEAARPDVTVTSSIPDRLYARTDTSLRTALYQVLENAVEHHDGEAPTIEITVCDRSNEGMLAVSIADDGPGMPDEERELLQGDREITQLRHASGLGLWLVNLVVAQAGGKLSFEANDPRGTVVTLEVPRADADLVRTTGDTTATGD